MRAPMAAVSDRGKLYGPFTCSRDPDASGKPGLGGKGKQMVWLALAMFVVLFGWGSNYFGWSDPTGKVQLALFTSFILGVICGYKNKD